MKKNINFKTTFSLADISDAIKKLPLVKKWKGGDSYYMGTHFNVEFENGVKIKIYDTSTSDAIGVDPKISPMNIDERRNQIGYEMDIEISEGDGSQIILSVLDAIKASEVKES